MFVKLFDNMDLNLKYNQMIRSTLSIEETLDLIYENKLSVSRFGDGEIQMTNTVRECAFETPSYYGTSKLRTVITEKHEKLLICLSGDAKGEFWESFWKREFSKFSHYLDFRLYGNTAISRSTVFHKLEKKAVDKWQRIWADRDVVFVTGRGSRFDSDHILFSNIKNKEIVLSQPKGAIDDIPRLLSELSKKSKDTLILLALGPAATILAYELTLLGYQAIDIGHINSCYDHVYNGALVPEKLPMEN